ncbi:glycoside hydrolase family 88/105 protein [Chondrinema litorale]|uniref:glycoside hydrolase family 88/105 protein n=1 Tax=Chondrinema litorale TaxID=2994555 RepID=UPI00254362D6|nr:glycoside hydrolase family 88 protein [Chondrinema litorale]UZR97627.1 glycoside hydrolase family 88 protein [Chondrinema litorale]
MLLPHKKFRITILVLLVTLPMLWVFTGFKNEVIREIPKDKKWSERMALSIMMRNPSPLQLDFRETPKWEYTQGLVLKSIEKLSNVTKDKSYQQYVEKYADEMIDAKGEIATYNITDFNIDRINPGRILFKVYNETKEEKYKIAIETLREQLKWQPRTKEGGFWHKLRYPWQMWLDGLYMGSPFYAEYAKINNETEAFDDIAKQFILIEKYTRDEKTGLLYHGWDESHLQDWSNDKTGKSLNFWGRAMGWYAMALVDVLDYFPADHPQRAELITILNRTIEAVEKYQDSESGVWYQVLDQGDKKGNYLEASGSCMFVYAIAKGVNKGYLDKKYIKVAEKGYEGVLNEFVEVNEDNGEVHIHNVCAVAGLGGDGNRSGTYEYYVNEPKRSNDPKATGPFIQASLELNK